MRNLAHRLSRLETVLPAEPQPATAGGLSPAEELRAILAEAMARKDRCEPDPPPTPETKALTRELRELLSKALSRQQEIGPSPRTEGAI